MDNRLLKLFLNYATLSAEEIAAIDKTMRVENFKKGTILLREGQQSSDVFFVLEGIVRLYFLTDGVEKTSDFFTEEQWVSSSNTISPDLPSKHFLECATDCKLLVGNSRKGEELYSQFPNLGTIARKVMNDTFLAQQEKLEAHIKDAPQARYLKLIESNPELFQRVPQYQIASYIGVTPESLSRIRRRILQKS